MMCPARAGCRYEDVRMTLGWDAGVFAIPYRLVILRRRCNISVARQQEILACRVLGIPNDSMILRRRCNISVDIISKRD